MAKFSYWMQNILDIKYKMEEQAKSSFAAAMARLRTEKDKLDAMFARKKELEEDYRNKAQGQINVFDLSNGRKARDFQKELIKEQMVEVRVAQKNVEMARARLNDVMKDRKTHEKLREHAFEDFLHELSDQEKKEIDELVSYQYSTKAR